MTILIQMVNFIISYVIIRNLLLEPAVKAIAQEEQDKTQTMSAIEQLKNANLAKQDTIKNRWATCHLALQNQAPKVAMAEKTMFIKETDTHIKVPQPRPENIDPLVTQIVQELTERLSHVR